MTITVSSVGSSGALSMSSLASSPTVVTTSLSPTNSNSYLTSFEPLSPSSYASAPVVASKTRQHRVAKIIDNNSNTLPKNVSAKLTPNASYPLQSPKDAASLSEDFLQKLRQEYGEQWLVIFNELIRDNELSRHEQQRTKEIKKNKNQEISPTSLPPDQTLDEDDSIISDAAKRLQGQSPIDNINNNEEMAPKTATSLKEFSPNQFSEQSQINVTSPTTEITEKVSTIDSPNLQSSSKNKLSNLEEQILVEDFYVQQRASNGSVEERILEFKVHSNILSYGKQKTKAKSDAQEQIVMHKDDTLSELDVYTAMSVITIPLSSLVRVELIQSSQDKHQTKNMSALSLGLAQQAAEKPIVEFEFRRDYADRTEHEVLSYQLEDISAQSKLFALVEPIVKFNTRDNYVRCMNCNHVDVLQYDQTKPDNCVQCQSPYIVILDEYQYENYKAEISQQEATQNQQPESASSEEEYEEDEIDLNLPKQVTITSFNNDTNIASMQTTKQLNLSDDEEFNILDDTNMQVYLRLSFMQKDKVMSMIAENILSILVCSFNYFGKSAEDEKLCYLALTNMNIFIIVQHKKPTEKDPGLSLHSQHKLENVKSIWVGLLYQSFRLDIADNGKEATTYLFITREQRKTQQFVDTLFDTMTNTLDEGCQMRFLNRQYLQSMSRLLGHLQPSFQENFQLYTMLFQNVKQSKWKPFDMNQLRMFQGGLKAFQGSLPSLANINIVPRSLVITNEKLILCDEDYCHFPSTEDTSKTANVHFSVKSEHNISDLIQIELASSVTQNCVRFKFETENDSSSFSPPSTKSQSDTGQSWELIVCSTATKNLLVETVAKKWKELFKIDLSVLHK